MKTQFQSVTRENLNFLLGALKKAKFVFAVEDSLQELCTILG